MAAGGRADLIAALGELFREQGYAGASLARITVATGLGKGSLYHAFPGGKADMAAAVLADINAWFREALFVPLRTGPADAASLQRMLAVVRDYFAAGRRLCLAGVFALEPVPDPIADAVRYYLAAWIDSLTDSLRQAGVAPEAARLAAEETVATIQGALLLARGVGDAALFGRVLDRLSVRLAALLPGG